MSWSAISTFIRKHEDDIDYHALNVIYICLVFNALMGMLKFGIMLGLLAP